MLPGVQSQSQIKADNNAIPNAIPQDFIAFYPMDADGVSGSTLLDESANNYNGTITGATQTSDYLEFDGVDDYVTGISKFLSGLTAFTISLNIWFDETPTQSGGDMDLVTCGGHRSNSPFFFWWDTSTNDYLYFAITDSSGTYLAFESDLTPPVGEWCNIVLTFSGNGEARLYLNDVENAGGAFDVSTIDDVGTSVDAQDDNSIGFAHNNNGGSIGDKGKFLDGRARNWRFYDRVVTSGELTALASGD